MVCSNCGHPLGPDDQYCGGCGAFLTAAPDEEQSGTPTQDDPWAAAPAPPPARSGPSVGMFVAGIAALALVGLLLLWFVRSGDGDSSATSPTTPAQTATDGATDAPATDEPAETPTGTTTEIPPPATVERPASSQECGTVGSTVVYRGNDTTSCPFAENVARAYADLEQPITAETTLSGVTSPVTNESYDLTCEYTTPVRCTGGNNAVVYLAPSS